MNETKSVKALKKQLGAAIAMVTVAAVALGSSTYAWFVNNSVVTATGMKVQAQTEGGIEIAYSNATATTGDYSTTATTGGTPTISLAPTSTKDAEAWYHAGAASSGASAAQINTYETLNTTETAIAGQEFGKTGGVTNGENTTNYYMHQTFNIRSTSATSLAKGLTVKQVSVAGNTKDMSEALRVAVKLGNKVLFYDPVANDTTKYDVFSGHTSDTQATKAGEVTCIDKDTPTLLASTQDITIPAKATGANGGVDVEVYIWFEGEDAQLYSDNFSTDELTVSIQFSATTDGATQA